MAPDLATVRAARLIGRTGELVAEVGVCVAADGSLVASLSDDEAERTYAIALLDAAGVQVCAAPTRIFAKEA